MPNTKTPKRTFRITWSGDAKFPYSLIDDTDTARMLSASVFDLAGWAFECGADECVHEYLQVRVHDEVIVAVPETRENRAVKP